MFYHLFFCSSAVACVIFILLLLHFLVIIVNNFTLNYLHPRVKLVEGAEEEVHLHDLVGDGDKVGVLVIFSLLSVPVTSVVSSVIQLTNITLISLYWLISRPSLRVRTIALVRRLFCRQQSVFIVPVS